jgi:hypothetical protein
MSRSVTLSRSASSSPMSVSVDRTFPSYCGKAHVSGNPLIRPSRGEQTESSSTATSCVFSLRENMMKTRSQLRGLRERKNGTAFPRHLQPRGPKKGMRREREEGPIQWGPMLGYGRNINAVEKVGKVGQSWAISWPPRLRVAGKWARVPAAASSSRVVWVPDKNNQS